MKDQYKDSGPAAKITSQSAESKNTDTRVRELRQQVEEQQKQIDRMHRDIVRLRVALNEVAARIK